MAADDVPELTRRLNILIALTLCQLEHRTEAADVITVLSRFGIEPREIAAVLGITPNAVRVARYRLRRSSAKSRTSRRKK